MPQMSPMNWMNLSICMAAMIMINKLNLTKVAVPTSPIINKSVGLQMKKWTW